MWNYDLDIQGIPTFSHPASLYGHRSTHSHARTSAYDSGSRARSFEILHSPQDCAHCHIYKAHVVHAYLQDYVAFERDRTDASLLGSFSSPDHDILRELSQVRTDLRRVRRERDGVIALNSRYQHEVALLESQLREAKDRLLAIEITYGDETQLWNTDSLNEGRDNGLLREQVERDADFDVLSRDNDSLDMALGIDDELWMMEDPTAIHAAASPNASWDDISDDFDLVQQLHFITEEDETLWNVCSSSDDLQNPPQMTTNNTLPTHYDSSSNSFSSSPSTSSSSLSESDLADSQSDDFSSPSTNPTISSDEELRPILNLMAAAHEEGNITALTQIKELIVKAERTPRQSRTKGQKYILLNWRRSSSSGRNPNYVSTRLQPAPLVNPLPSSPKEIEIFVDASPLGIGFVFKTHWLAWTFKNTCNIQLGKDGKIVMSWAELLAVEVGLRALIAAGYRSTTITLRSDNMGVIDALNKKAWCQKHGIEEILQNILNLCREYGINLRPSWISTKTNPADMPSRGVFPPRSLLFKFPPKLPARLLDLLELAAPETA